MFTVTELGESPVHVSVKIVLDAIAGVKYPPAGEFHEIPDPEPAWLGKPEMVGFDVMAQFCPFERLLTLHSRYAPVPLRILQVAAGDAEAVQCT